MNIYLAARYSRRVEMRDYMLQLENMGHKVTSRWLWTQHSITDDDLDRAQKDEYVENLARRYAWEDLTDVANSDLLILFTEKQRVESRGGRMVEFGYALASGKTVWVVGPDENVFSTLAANFKTWEKALDSIENLLYNREVEEVVTS